MNGQNTARSGSQETAHPILGFCYVRALMIDKETIRKRREPQDERTKH
jgi:hypothetical protein